jgi:transposase
MYLKKIPQKSTGRMYLYIAEGYRDKAGKPKSKSVKKIGYVDELLAEYDDPIAYFTEVAETMTAEAAKEKTVTFQIESEALVERDASNRKNYGHIVFSKIYHELEIDRFLDNKRRHENFKYNSESIMRLLLFGRLLYPRSKLGTYEIRDRFFDNFKFTIDDIYECLTHYDKISGSLQQFLHEKVSSQYKRDTSLVYYDVTNYYFETDNEDDFKKRGADKAHTGNPIVQMGLALDRAGIPITYSMFSGNTHDSQTYMPVMKEIRKKYNVDRIIVVADKGLNSGDNIAFNTILGDGYIFSKSIRGSSEAFKEYALDESGYKACKEKEYRSKSRLVPTEINVTLEGRGTGKKTKKVALDQKQIIIYSSKYARRSKFKREQLLAKAVDLINNPSKYKRATTYGAAGYISNLRFDKRTGAIVDTGEKLKLDIEKIREEEKYDGYYAIVTSELDMPDSGVIESYHGLWRIEESFKITKSTLGARPVFLRTKEHINAHFMICFIALLISRLVEIRLGYKYNIADIINSLRQVECSHITQNYYLFDFADEVTDALNIAFGLNIGRKVMTLKEIKKNLGLAKK